MEAIQPHCQELSSPSIFNFCLSVLILLGILLSYLPQHYRIVALQSSFGISPYFVLLGTTSGTSAFANILVLPRSAEDIACCKEINGFACFAGLLGIFQVGTQALCFAIILVLFMLYFPRVSTVAIPKTSDPSPSFRVALIVLAICVVHAVATIVAALTVVLAYPSSRQFCANILGIIAAILSSIQYFPQIYTTFMLRRIGSLSIPMMCIQTPGSIVWVASLAARLGPEGWSTWGVYLVTAILQGTLLVMAVYFEYVSPIAAAADEGVADGDTVPENGRANGRVEDAARDHDQSPSENTPLLRSSQ